MKLRLFLLALLMAACFAQKPKNEPIERCELGSKHNCQCMDRFHAIQAKISDACRRNTHTLDELTACMQRVPFYCNVIDRVTQWDIESGSTLVWNAEKDQYEGSSKMGPICTGACKKRDCACADGPSCHLGHNASDHETGNRKR